MLDSSAVLRYLEGAEPAAQAVADLLDTEHPVVSWIDLGEVFYVLRRTFGENDALETIRDLRRRVLAEVASAELVLDAARIKTDYPLAYADAFAAATAVVHAATLWTGDPELLVEGAPWSWMALR